MKKKRILFPCCLAVLSIATSVLAQGTFRNLNFEEANFVNPPAPASPTNVSFADAFPGWTGYAGTNQLTQTAINGVSLGAAAVTLITPNTAPIGFASSNDVIAGTYTAVMAAGQFNGIVPVALAQSGLVPATAQSLRFSLVTFSVVSDLGVTFNGQNIPFFALAAGTNYTVYCGDISAFQGVMGELRFTESPISSPFSKAWIDDILFSNQPIPEPSTFGLFALGALLLGWRLRTKLKL